MAQAAGSVGGESDDRRVAKRGVRRARRWHFLDPVLELLEHTDPSSSGSILPSLRVAPGGARVWWGCVNITRAGRDGRSRARRGWTHPFLSSFSNARRRSSASFFFAKRSCASGGGGREVKPLTATRVSFGAREARRGRRGRRRARRGARRVPSRRRNPSPSSHACRSGRGLGGGVHATLGRRQRHVALPAPRVVGARHFHAVTSGREGVAAAGEIERAARRRVAARIAHPKNPGRARPGRDRLNPAAFLALSLGCAR